MKSEISQNYYVADVQKHRVLIRHFGEQPPKQPPPLNALQSASDSTLWSIPVETGDALASIFTVLRDLDVAFLDLPGGWPPAAVFEQLRDEGKISGPFTSVRFSGANSPTFQKGK